MARTALSSLSPATHNNFSFNVLGTVDDGDDDEEEDQMKLLFFIIAIISYVGT